MEIYSYICIVIHIWSIFIALQQHKQQTRCASATNDYRYAAAPHAKTPPLQSTDIKVSHHTQGPLILYYHYNTGVAKLCELS